MTRANLSGRRPQLVCTLVACVAVLTHALGFVAQPGLAATSAQQGQQPESAAATSTQPLWSYQVKPANYVGVGPGSPQGNGNGYSGGFGGGGPASLLDAFTGGLSQRQGALSQGSPFLAILPIILIAAGGLLLLLPMLTMMMASPFGGGAFGGGAGGYQNYGGYPQVGALNKRRSLDSGAPLLGGYRGGIIELIEHVSSTIEDLSRKYAPQQSGGAQQQHSASAGAGAGAHKRSAKALSGAGNSALNNNSNNLAANHQHQQQPANEAMPAAAATAANHKPAGDEATNGLGNLVGGSL